MTEDNKRLNIGVEIERGDASLRAAEILLREGLLADAVSRAYYAAFHYARALLLTLGLETKTHSGLSTLLQRELVRPGAFPADVARLFAELQRFRQDADYTAEFVFTFEHAAEEVEHANRFRNEARSLLARGGWLES